MRLPSITPTRLPYRQLLIPSTMREFSGGWNVKDDELNLSYKYSMRLRNCTITSNGSIRVRNGTRRFTALGTHVINMEYFLDSIVAVVSNGDVYRIFGDGSFILLDSTLWGDTSFVSFAKFNSHLILCNGVDKPLDIDDNFVIELLQDAATLTNINVPICKYVVAINRYLVMAGDPLEPDRVHISAKDAAGTWFDDPPPNDATRVDVGSVLPSATTIRGLAVFRGKLVVMFAEGLVFGTLGIYDANGNHAPDFDDGIEGFGSVCHRSGVAYGDDVLFLDLEGVPSIKRTVLSTSFKPERMSELIDSEIVSTMSGLDFAALEDRVFAIHNKRDKQYWLFVPNNNSIDDTTETRVFVYNRLSDNVEAWSDFTDWNFTCGTRSMAGEIFFGDADGNIWLYAGDTDYADPTATPVVLGDGIEFDWQTVWLDYSNRALSKHSKYISFDTKGRSEFTCEMYVDELEDVTLSTEFSAGEQGQFGGGPQPYGGGRNTSRKRKYAWNAKFMICRFRFHGVAEEGLEFISITLHYLMAGINR